MRTLACLEGIANQAGIEHIWAVFKSGTATVIQWHNNTYRSRYEIVLPDDSLMTDTEVLENLRHRLQSGAFSLLPTAAPTAV
jgi:hypothetical protein